MKYDIHALLAAIAVFGGSAFLSPAVLAEDVPGNEKIEATAADATQATQLQRDLEQRALKDAEAMAADAMIAAGNLDLDIREAGPISVLMASEL